MTVRQWVRITPEGVEGSGRPLATTARGTALLTELYRCLVGDYPKFFKMDEPSRLGFLAAELLLLAELEAGQTAETEARQTAETDAVVACNGSLEECAVILFGRSGSIVSDRRFQLTIEHADDYYPSPSVFVYTLPNIVAGEIAQRHGLHGETAFYLLPQRDDRLMFSIVEASLADSAASCAISGWVDFEASDRFEAYIELNVK